MQYCLCLLFFSSVEYENICGTCAEGKAGKRCGACKKVSRKLENIF